MRSSLPNVPMMGRGNNSTMAVCHLAELLKFINKAAWESHSEWDTAQWFASWESLRTCSTMTSLKWADVFHASGVVSGSLGWDPTYKLSLVFNRVHESIPNTNYNSDSHEMSIELDAQNCNVVGEKSGLKHLRDPPHWLNLNGTPKWPFFGPMWVWLRRGTPKNVLRTGETYDHLLEFEVPDFQSNPCHVPLFHSRFMNLCPRSVPKEDGSLLAKVVLGTQRPFFMEPPENGLDWTGLWQTEDASHQLWLDVWKSTSDESIEVKEMVLFLRELCVQQLFDDMCHGHPSRVEWPWQYHVAMAWEMVIAIFFGKNDQFQWEFQEPQFEVATIYKSYFSGLNFREYPHNSYGQTYGTNVPLF